MDKKIHFFTKKPDINGWRMLPNEKEKEALVIDLLKKGHTTREISKMANVSNTTIKKTRQKITKDDIEEKNEPKNKQLSISSQAFKLFLEGKSIVQVAIGLDLPTDQVLKIHSDYLILNNMGMASRLLTEHRKNLSAYLNLLDYLNENSIKVKDLDHAISLAKRISNLKSEKAQLEYDIDTLMNTKQWYETELDKVKNNYYKIR